MTECAVIFSELIARLTFAISGEPWRGPPLHFVVRHFTSVAVPNRHERRGSPRQRRRPRNQIPRQPTRPSLRDPGARDRGSPSENPRTPRRRRHPPADKPACRRLQPDIAPWARAEASSQAVPRVPSCHRVCLLRRLITCTTKGALFQDPNPLGYRRARQPDKFSICRWFKGCGAMVGPCFSPLVFSPSVRHQPHQGVHYDA
jgi:hypothetical protein